ncbi:hydrolase [Sphingomonas sp. SUN039]|uniref:hydrolase n=1 Tax=Sphingomonas sp. SUN039 TaxID=2937787 RepID=UPI0021648A37|nr:hydrolase [Sphingomonas sp. SUN039]UVO53420.1 hydrolase [Sphingomonas sp. SUN039]
MALTQQENALIARAYAAPMRAQVERWAAINSGTGNLAGLAEVAGLLAEQFAVLPGDICLVDQAPEESISSDGHVRTTQRGQHIHLAVRPGANRRILLTGHMDTVFPADHPFQMLREIEPGVINGPGVADMKGGIAVMLAALAAFEGSDAASALGYDVLLNSDEETGSASSAGLIAELARGKIAALTYEPAALPDGTLAGARPGSGNFSFVVTGKSAHAGRNPDDGRNAVIAAADLALRLAALRREGLSVNPAKIDGGGPNNVVPDHAVLRVNLRPLTPELEAEAKAALAEIVADVARRHDVSVHPHGGFGRPPKPLDPPAEKLFGLVRDCGADLGQSIAWKATGGVCDGNNIAACGVPVVDTMGVRGGAIHSDQEYLIVESLAERAALSALTLYRLANGAI